MIFKDHEEPLISSKNSFYFGLMCGIALVSLVGFIIISSPSFSSQFSKTGSVDQNNNVVADNNAAANQPTNPTQPDATKPVAVKVAATDHIRGNKNAPVTIVEFSDYQCPYCANFHSTMQEVMKAYPTQVRWVFKQFPLSFHPYAQKAAEAAECASDQNKFWEYTDMIYANQASLSDAYLTTAATNLKLDVKKFSSCLSSGKYTAKVKADQTYGQSLGVQGTPGSFINGVTIPGAVPFSQC